MPLDGAFTLRCTVRAAHDGGTSLAAAATRSRCTACLPKLESSQSDSCGFSFEQVTNPFLILLEGNKILLTLDINDADVMAAPDSVLNALARRQGVHSSHSSVLLSQASSVATEVT